MRSARASVVAIISLTVLQLTSGQSDDVPNVQLELLKPKGLRVSIPDVPKLSLFVFQGNINHGIKADDLGTLSGEVLRPTAGRWVYENRNVELKDGDVINYYLVWIIDQVEHRRDNLTYQVKANRASDGTEQDGCRPTVTTMRMGKACAGQVIFEDNFDTFNEDVWQIEQYIRKDHSDYPFNSYQRSTVAVVNGSLHISPVLQQNLPGYSADSFYSGTLDLFSGCTSSAESCFMRASGADILPPVASGRVTSKGFAFKYGTMELRARLPQGDWLYPEILLEPLLNKYGSWNQASGILKLACARGNAVLHADSTDYGNKILYGGPIIDTRCRDALMSSKVASGGTAWGDAFHVYSMRWTPELITWSVDGAEWGRIEAGEGGLRTRLPPACADTRDAPHAPPGNTKMAPFDEHFYMTLGVAVGGIAEFPDGVVTMNGHPKPWRNHERKAALRFWQDMGSWLSTWNQSKLVVDYIRIRAL